MTTAALVLVILACDGLVFWAGWRLSTFWHRDPNP